MDNSTTIIIKSTVPIGTANKLESIINSRRANINFSVKKHSCVITNSSKKYDGGIVIVPVYLSKELEFDVVFILDVSDEKYRNNEMEAKLLYVACTRALHKLYLLHPDNVSPLLT